MYACVDVETSYQKGVSQYPWTPGSYLSCVGIVTNTGIRKCWPFNHKQRMEVSDATDQEQVEEIRSILRACNSVVGHNLPFDLLWLDYLDVRLDGVKLWDTALVQYLLSGQTHVMPSLDDTAFQWLGRRKIDVVKTQYWERGVNTYDVPWDILADYCALADDSDCTLTINIADRQASEVQQQGMVQLVKLKNEEIPCVVDIMQNGMRLDEVVRKRLEDEYTTRSNQITEDITRIGGKSLNLNSPEQLSCLLFGGDYGVGARCWYEQELKGGRKALRSRKESIKKHYDGLGFKPLPNTQCDKIGQYSTSKDVLVQLKRTCTTKDQKEVIQLLLDRSAVAQMMKTYIMGIQDKHVNGEIHCQVNQTVTATGRASSSKPNLFNIPREGTSPVKEMFKPRLGWFVAGDASQLEWRGAAYLSQCPVMMKEIREGVDQHQAASEEFFSGKVERVIAKVFNFRMIFRGTPYSFYMDPRMPDFSLKRWTEIVQAFYKKYYGLAEWHQFLIKEVYRNRGELRSITGRRFVFKLYEDKHGKHYNEAEIANYPVQSISTAELTSMAMIEVRKRLAYLGREARLCNWVYDDVMYDTTEKNISVVANTMLEVFNELPQLFEQRFGINWNVPLSGECKYGPNWKDMTKYEH